MTKIKSIHEISVKSFKTSDSYTGAPLDENLEEKLVPIKRKLVKKALKQYKIISACSPLCFQIYDQKLFFWFNSNETTKTISETVSILY